MRYSDINKMFTDKVGEYIANGYSFNTGTMSGSQGEVAKADMTDGKEIVRVALKKICTRGHDGYELSVGRAVKDTDKINAGGTYSIIWNSDLEVISSEKYYHADYLSNWADWFVSYKEACENAMLAMGRMRFMIDDDDEELPDKAKDIALKYVRRQPGCSRARRESVNVRKVNGHYHIYYRNKDWRLA